MGFTAPTGPAAWNEFPGSDLISRGTIQEWILDVAHNPAGAWALRAAVRGILESHQPRLLVFSCLRDKPLSEMAQILFPLFDEVIVVPIQNARAAALEDLLAAAAATGTPATSADSVSDALRMARDRLTQNRVTHNWTAWPSSQARFIS